MQEFAGSRPLRHIALALLALAGMTLLWGVAPVMAGDASSPFPIAIEHKFGTTIVPEEPKRVVSIGYHDHEYLLAVGVVPVALRYNYGDHPYGVFPWGQSLLGDAQPELLHVPVGELDFEAIASWRPDLISAVYSGITQEEYERLSRIAPTIAQTDDYIDFGMPWQEQAVMIGTAVGRKENAEAAVAAVEAHFEAVRREHPEFAGKKVVLAVWRQDGQIGLLAEQDLRTRVFTDMGFEVPDSFTHLFGDLFYAFISLEQIRMLDDADVVVWNQMAWSIGRKAIEEHPLYRNLRIAREGRHIFLENDLDDALQYGTVLSLPYLLDEVVPILEQVFSAHR